MGLVFKCIKDNKCFATGVDENGNPVFATE